MFGRKKNSKSPFSQLMNDAREKYAEAKAAIEEGRNERIASEIESQTKKPSPSSTENSEQERKSKISSAKHPLHQFAENMQATATEKLEESGVDTKELAEKWKRGNEKQGESNQVEAIVQKTAIKAGVRTVASFIPGATLITDFVTDHGEAIAATVGLGQGALETVGESAYNISVSAVADATADAAVSKKSEESEINVSVLDELSTAQKNDGKFSRDIRSRRSI